MAETNVISVRGQLHVQKDVFLSSHYFTEAQILEAASHVLYRRLCHNGTHRICYATIEQLIRMQFFDDKESLFTGLFFNKSHQLLNFETLYFGLLEDHRNLTQKVYEEILKLKACHVIIVVVQPKSYLTQLKRVAKSIIDEIRFTGCQLEQFYFFSDHELLSLEY